eukprot:TRINITY_DN6977_c0_g1_i1.p1 TRINITY_DN6977_c0_g1~~TRINITY_DN6977_c0_g1_i1.p1  ORF type:complete len:181 (+),score=41.80 TRINITY_DN6977_c0_g1_i1:199-741(+)
MLPHDRVRMTLVDGAPVAVTGGQCYCPWTGELLDFAVADVDPGRGGDGIADALALHAEADELDRRWDEQEAYCEGLGGRCKALLREIIAEDPRMAYTGRITELYVRSELCNRPSLPRPRPGPSKSLAAVAKARRDALRQRVAAMDAHLRKLERIFSTLMEMRVSLVDQGPPIEDFDDIDF